MLTAEVFNWTGHVLMTPRTQISEALKRKEARYTGIYLLIGEKDGTPLAYIGEAEDISDRIRIYDSKRDWWNTANLVTSAANNLNKAHVKYLESRLIEEARAVGKIALENVTTPARPGLSEAAQPNMEAFIDYVLMVLPALRSSLLLKNTRPASQPADRIDLGKAPLFELLTPKHGISATAKLENGELVVQGQDPAPAALGKVAGPRIPLTVSFMRNWSGWEFLSSRGRNEFSARNAAFKSPSAAAAVVNGRPANGTIEWKVQGQNKTYKQWEAENSPATMQIDQLNTIRK